MRYLISYTVCLLFPDFDFQDQDFEIRTLIPNDILYRAESEVAGGIMKCLMRKSYLNATMKNGIRDAFSTADITMAVPCCSY